MRKPHRASKHKIDFYAEGSVAITNIRFAPARNNNNRYVDSEGNQY